MLDIRSTTDAIGRDAYDAYTAAVDSKSVKGEPLPDWDALTTPVRNAWQLAAEAVRHRVALYN